MSRLHRLFLSLTVPRAIGLRLLWGALGNFSTPRSLALSSTILGLAGLQWLGASAIAPPAAIAYTARTSIPLVRQGDESFESFLRRAEAIARAAAQRSFDSDILVTNVSITILGQNSGSVLPVLILNVSRPDWRRQPEAQRWGRYFPNAPVLLGFEPPPGSEDEESPAPEQPNEGTEPPPPTPGGGSPPPTTDEQPNEEGEASPTSPSEESPPPTTDEQPNEEGEASPTSPSEESPPPTTDEQPNQEGEGAPPPSPGEPPPPPRVVPAPAQ
ncbi:MAG: hypothetical protein SW833_28420 [Cyanobacteriota bacterium]|nr:hypothetical protein [Cyanobacteriota bacterium]